MLWNNFAFRPSLASSWMSQLILPLYHLCVSVARWTLSFLGWCSALLARQPTFRGVDEVSQQGSHIWLSCDLCHHAADELVWLEELCCDLPLSQTLQHVIGHCYCLLSSDLRECKGSSGPQSLHRLPHRLVPWKSPTNGEGTH